MGQRPMQRQVCGHPLSGWLGGLGVIQLQLLSSSSYQDVVSRGTGRKIPSRFLCLLVARLGGAGREGSSFWGVKRRHAGCHLQGPCCREEPAQA